LFQPASLSLKVKESHHDPVEKSQSVAEFVGAMGIEDEPVRVFKYSLAASCAARDSSFVANRFIAKKVEAFPVSACVYR
jgi:hypothetical protein